MGHRERESRRIRGYGVRLLLAAVCVSAALAGCGGGSSGGGTGASTTPTSPAPVRPTSAEAFAFLDEATFGPKPAEVQRVTQIGYEAWLDEQIALPPTYHLPVVRELFAANPPPQGQPQSQNDRLDAWFRAALNGPDALRQKVATPCRRSSSPRTSARCATSPRRSRTTRTCWCATRSAISGTCCAT